MSVEIKTGKLTRWMQHSQGDGGMCRLCGLVATTYDPVAHVEFEARIAESGPLSAWTRSHSLCRECVDVICAFAYEEKWIP